MCNRQSEPGHLLFGEGVKAKHSYCVSSSAKISLGLKTVTSLECSTEGCTEFLQRLFGRLAVLEYLYRLFSMDFPSLLSFKASKILAAEK